MSDTTDVQTCSSCPRCPLKTVDERVRQESVQVLDDPSAPPTAPPFRLLGMDRNTVSAILTHTVTFAIGMGVAVLLILIGR